MAASEKAVKAAYDKALSAETKSASADKLTTARNISLTGDVTGSASFDGSANAAITSTLKNSGVTAGSYGASANATPAHGGSFTVPQITVDAQGRVTGAANRTVKLPAAPSVSGTTGTVVSVNDLATSASYTAPSFGAFTGWFYHGKETYRYVYINGKEVWRCRWGDSGWGSRQEPFTIIVGKGGKITVGGDTAHGCKFIPINLQ